jgi:hypothetical protein
MNAPEVESFDRVNAAIARLSEALLLPVGQGVNLDGTIQRLNLRSNCFGKVPNAPCWLKALMRGLPVM